METIARIPVTLNGNEIAVRLRLGPTPSESGRADLDALIALARELLAPRAVYEAADVEARGEGTVEVAGVSFKSHVLSGHLAQIKTAFPYIITVGSELERVAAAQGDLLKQYFLEEMANMALERVAGWLASRLEKQRGLSSLSTLSPGSLEDWPITEQTKLFSIFGDTERLVGVRLTESMLMIPRKSVSGIMFPSEEGFAACQLCDRANCPGRKALYMAT